MTISISLSGATNTTAALGLSLWQERDILSRNLVHPSQLPLQKARRWISMEEFILISAFISHGANGLVQRHVALLKIQGTEFELTSIPLRTVRPFVMDAMVLTEVAEEEGFDVTNQMEITRYLKLRVSHTVFPFELRLILFQVSELINKANDMWDRRNAQAVEEGEAELPRMLPLVRLKVDDLLISLC